MLPHQSYKSLSKQHCFTSASNKKATNNKNNNNQRPTAHVSPSPNPPCSLSGTEDFRTVDLRSNVCDPAFGAAQGSNSIKGKPSGRFKCPANFVQVRLRSILVCAIPGDQVPKSQPTECLGFPDDIFTFKMCRLQCHREDRRKEFLEEIPATLLHALGIPSLPRQRV